MVPPGTVGGDWQYEGMRDPREGRSADGMIVTGAAFERLHPSFGPSLDAAVAAVGTAAPDAALYVYGSVATGQAEVGRSDVDLLAIDLPTDRAHSITSTLSGRFADMCRGVEIGACASTGFVGDRDEAYGNRVFLRHYCVPLSGSDRHRPDHDFPADVRAARGFNGDLARHRDRWRAELATAPDVGALAIRIARKTLLAVAGLVSMHDTIWTTDRTLAADRWSEVEPEHADALTTLLAWTHDEPAVARGDVEHLLDDVVDPLVARFARDIGLWP